MASTEHRSMHEVIDHLLSRLDTRNPEQCWVWTGALGAGYGRAMVNGKLTSVHRLFCSWFHGPATAADDQAIHKCDNRACCNPEHLSWGSPRRNSIEARDRFRNLSNQKLDHDTVQRIRDAAGKQRDIAKEFGISQAQVSKIKTGKQWRTL